MEENLAEQKVAYVLEQLDIWLALARPDGKTNHRRDGLRQGILFGIEDCRKRKFPVGETFGDLRGRDAAVYGVIVGFVVESLEDFGVGV